MRREIAVVLLVVGTICVFVIGALVGHGDLGGPWGVSDKSCSDCPDVSCSDTQYPFNVSVSAPIEKELLNFRGPVVWPSSKTYVNLRLPWQGFYNYSSYPTVIVQPKTAEDVRIALQFAANKGLRVIPRNGGHSYSGLSVTRGMVIDVSLMNDVEVGPSLLNGDTLVTIGAGQTNFGMYVNLARVNLSVPGGGCPSVGLSGLTLGGGFGSVSRTFGIAADRVESIEVVAFDKSTNAYKIFNVNSTTTHTKDLFFALRGGMGGNYGVVTRWQYRAFPIHTVYAFSFDGSAELNETVAVTTTFINWANTDSEYKTTVEIAFNSGRCDEPADPNAAFDKKGCISTQQQRQLTIEGTCVCDGEDCTKCKHRVDNLSTMLSNLPGDSSWESSAKKGPVSWYERIWDIAGCTSIYKEIKKRQPANPRPIIKDGNITDCIKYWQKGIGRSKNNRKKSLFLLSDPDSTFFEHVLDFMSTNAEQIVSPGLGTNIEMYHWSGEMTKMPAAGKESAWSHRDVKWLVHITSAFTARTNTSVISAQQQLLDSLHDSLTQAYRVAGKLQDYQNFPDTSLAYNLWTTAYFPPATLRSLIATNTKYNPQNIYRTEMSIPVSYP